MRSMINYNGGQRNTECITIILERYTHHGHGRRSYSNSRLKTNHGWYRGKQAEAIAVIVQGISPGTVGSRRCKIFSVVVWTERMDVAVRAGQLNTELLDCWEHGASFEIKIRRHQQKWVSINFMRIIPQNPSTYGAPYKKFRIKISHRPNPAVPHFIHYITNCVRCECMGALIRCERVRRKHISDVTECAIAILLWCVTAEPNCYYYYYCGCCCCCCCLRRVYFWPRRTEFEIQIKPYFVVHVCVTYGTWVYCCIICGYRARLAEPL